MSLNTGTVTAEILDVGRAAADLHDSGLSWPVIAEQLDETAVYVRRAHAAYLAHVDEVAHRGQLGLFDL
ncbi:MAG: hypothetical protein INR66_21450 [Gordonia polyisoprenivorans]|nr:hypothetical protein [Gordonia polyisoprenivorans]